jgi:hypothetical protein
MRSELEYFLTSRPAYPWSEYPLGPTAFGIVALLLIALTLYTYFRHPNATRRRVTIILLLRLAALAIALITAIRPSVGIQEDPKIPSHIIITPDLSESMTIKDEFNNQTRIAAVRKILEKCEPILEELRNEQNVVVTMYALGKSDFDEATSSYDPTSAAESKVSDYGAYLNRTFEKWQSERFVRAHLIIGDGADNGTRFLAQAEAARWRNISPIHTFAVGSKSTPPSAKDVAIVAVSAEPQPVPIKQELKLKVIVNAYGFAGAKVPVVISFNDEPVRKEDRVLTKESGNELEFMLKAPEKPGEVRVRVEIPLDKVPGDAAPTNNVLETYFTVTKEGIRILLVDRLRVENAMLRDVLGTEKRFDLVRVLRQGDGPPLSGERELFDFDANAYDVIVIGNISRKQLEAIDAQLPTRIVELVKKKGIGVLFLAGDASYAGTAARALDNGWIGTPFEDILPVSLKQFPNLPDSLFTGTNQRFQTVPTARGLEFLMKVSGDMSRETWDKLNTLPPDRSPPVRLNGISKLGTPKPATTVFAVAAEGLAREVVPSGQNPNQLLNFPNLLVGWQTGDRNGRVLAWAGMDTYLWKSFGRRATPPTRDGIDLHAQFWRRLILWLAHQEEDEGLAYARPEYRRMPVKSPQRVKIGLRTTSGVELSDAKYDVRIVAPGAKVEDATSVPVVADASGSRIAFEPMLPGEYTVVLKATGADSTGKEVKGDATARFIAYPETSDELLRAAADHDFLEKLAKASNGRAYRLDDLPTVLKELKSQPIVTVKPKPRFVPDWRRNQSGGFLTGWLVLFVLLLGVEWGLRRKWGLA